MVVAGVGVWLGGNRGRRSQRIDPSAHDTAYCFRVRLIRTFLSMFPVAYIGELRLAAPDACWAEALGGRPAAAPGYRQHE